MVKKYKEYFRENNLDYIHKEVFSILKEYELRQTKYILNAKIYTALAFIDQVVLEKSIQAMESGYSLYGGETLASLGWDDFTWALVMLALLPNLREEYYRCSIDIDVFYRTISDLIFRLSRYVEDKGEIGLYLDDRNWLMRIFFLKIFKLSSLQFEVYDDYKFIPDEVIKEHLKDELGDGSKYLAIHIMDGEDICPKTIDKDLNMANIFFDRDYKIFICYSWLLFEGMQKILKYDSNILNFQRRFDVLINFEDNRDAIKAIFSRKQERETSLQKKAKENLNSLGLGFGIIRREKFK